MKKLLIIGTAAIAVCGVCFTTSAEDGYIESEGDAFISLGHCAGPNTKIAVDLQMTELTFGTYPLGSYGNNKTSDCFEFYVSHGGDEIPRFSFEYSEAGVRCAHNCNRATLERYILSYDAHAQLYSSTNVTSGGTLFTDSFADKAPPTETSTYPISLFGGCTRKWASQSGHFTGAVKMKVFGVKIWESGTLVKTYVPCIRSGIPGLKVIVGDDVAHPQNVMFVTGVDVSKVKYGGDILVEKDDAHIDLENEIKDTGYGKNMCIDTDYIVGPQTRVELDYALLTGWSSSSKWSVNPCLFAANGMDLWVFGSNDGCYAYSLSTGGNQYYGSNRGEIANMSAATDYGIRRTAAMNSNSVWFVTAGFTNAVGTGTAISGNLPNTLKLGARYDRQRYIPIRIYGLKIYENDALVKDYVPVVTNGVPRLIERGSGTILTPITIVNNDNNNSKTNCIAVASGDFDAHTTDFEREAYLEFPETGSGIDTGYSVGRNSCIEADFALWKAGGKRQELIDQDSGTDSSYVTFTSAGAPWQIWFKFADETGTSAVDDTVNYRRQYIADRHNGTLTIKSGATTVKSVTMAGSNTRAGGGAKTLKLGRLNAAMRLYGFKIYEYINDVKTLQRNYVPCVTNGVAGLYDLCTDTFKPLTGGKVSGKGYSGQVDEFIAVPQPAKLTSSGTGSTATLTCFAPSAQSYEWYEDGVLMPGETSDSLTLNWDRSRAKMNNHTHTYSVKPVYTVFNEKVLGEAVAATVEYTPLGLAISIQ